MNMLKKIFVIFLILTGLFIIMTNLPLFSWFGLNNEQKEANVTDKVELIKIQTTSVPTTIIPEDRDDIVIDYEGQGSVDLHQGDDEIEIDAKGPKFQFGLFNRNSKLTIYIPEDYDRNISLKVGSGTLLLEGHSSQKPLSLEDLAVDIGSGKLELRNIEANLIEQKGSSGYAKLENIEANTGSFEISSGKLMIRHYSGALDAQVSSGFMDIQFDTLTGNSEVKVSSGSAKLDLPDDADFTLIGKMSSGKIDHDFQLTDKSSGKNHIEGKYGSGDNKLDLQVSSGHINLY